METEGSLPHSQQPATCPYPDSHQSSPWPHRTSWSSILVLSSYLRLGLPSVIFLSGFPTKTLYTPTRSNTHVETVKYVINKYESILIFLNINKFTYVSFSKYVSVKQNH